MATSLLEEDSSAGGATSFDDDSDEDDDAFLTTSHTGTAASSDREALVRKKLLESFYGKSAVAEGEATLDQSQQLSSDAPSRRRSARTVGSPKSGAHPDDIDSPSFAAEPFVQQHIRASSTHALLDLEEKMALQVRTLDSTMQTLVYENYSRFIDATDAIRSIGVNVTAHEAPMQRLVQAVQQLDQQSRSIETALAAVRDPVAEKIRIQRLLRRLDTLLHLPATLQQLIRQGQYRSAAKTQMQAASILARHSAGFASLKSIEAECERLVQRQLRAELQRKLSHWSGRSLAAADESEQVGYQEHEEDAMNLPDLPKNIMEIFECAGTLFILQEHDHATKRSSSETTDDDTMLLESEYEDLYSMALGACTRLLDRLLDTHMIQVQERRFEASTNTDLDPLDGSLNHASSGSLLVTGMEPPVYDGSSLIPQNVLVALLEAAQLYGSTFTSSDCGSQSDRSSSMSYYLVEFITESFASFMSHVRSILLEESLQASRRDSDGAEDGPNVESSHEEIAGALSLLVQSVQALAAGLTAPGIGLPADMTDQMVRQTLELSESMVRRRVDQRFRDLRAAIVHDGLLPLVQRAISERARAVQEGKVVLPELLPIASSTLSDCLQLVDDAIRSICSDSSSTENKNDLPGDLKDAVQTSSFQFASWLANALEILAGGDPSDGNCIAEAPLIDPADDLKQDLGLSQGVGDPSEQDLLNALFQARDDVLLSADIEECADFLLAMMELCRLAEASMSENLEQFFTLHLGTGKKKSRDLFVSSSDTATGPRHDDGNMIAKRFQLAGSRIFVLLVTNASSDAAHHLINDMADVAMKFDGSDIASPSPSMQEVLKRAKKLSLHCTSLMGGPKQGGPIPKWEDSIVGVGSVPAVSSLLASRKTGLFLDVERMFKETVTIYPHPFQSVVPSRDAALFLFFKIVTRSWFEEARMYRYSTGGYLQMQVDTIFLKYIIPHYVNSHYAEGSTNGVSAISSLIQDVREVVDEQCADESCSRDEALKQKANQIVQSFVNNLNSDATLADHFFIKESE
jgi:vacuolar protein sorting-associated protein 51